MTTLAAPSLRGRFTAGGEEAAEARVTRDMATVTELLVATFPRVRAIFLVGGYGRGEGAIVAGAAGPAPFNDYDLLLVFDRLTPLARVRHRRRAGALGPALARAAGVPVDLAIQDRLGLLEAPPSILWYEMVEGHRLIWGDPDVEFPRFDPARLPLDEAILLLTNRASALLLRDLEGPPETDVGGAAVRITDAMKLVLAWGDVLLLREGRYTVSYAARPAILRALASQAGPFADELRELYDEAVAFKLAPGPEALSARHALGRAARVRELHPVFLQWFEAGRVGRRFTSWREYARPDVRKLAGRPGTWTLARHLAKLGPPRDRENLRLHRLPTYERLIAVLPLLLFSREEADWDRAARLLNARPRRGAEQWRAPARRYVRLWR